MAALDAKAPAGLDPSHIDALVEVMLLAASVDGRLDDAEVEPLRQMLLSIDEQCLTRVSLEQRLLEAAKRIDASPRNDRFAALRDALPRPEQRLAALELTLRVVAADRQIQGNRSAEAVRLGLCRPPGSNASLAARAFC